MRNFPFILFPMVFIIMTACRAPGFLEMDTGELDPAEISAGELMELVPDYSQSLHTISGRGRAFVSQPGESDRLTLEFLSDREASLVNVRNRLGMDGARILTRDDSVLIYNRIDRIAEKVSLKEGDLSQVGSLAAINLLDLINFTIHKSEISDIYRYNGYYLAILNNQSRITIDRSTGNVVDVQSSDGSRASYSRIIYEEYENLDNFYLPRKITIFSRDGSSRITLLVQHLEVNLTLPELSIQIPEDISVQTL